MVDKKHDSTKRFGPRYGRKLKEKFADAEAGHRGRHKCPYCGKNNARRIAAGIWTCKSCNVKFTGRAYSIGKKSVTTEAVEEKPKKEIKEEDSSENTEKEGE
jgi:large subunit ribosomal protein L37Ae|tara:strand:+ start:1429 stop:1734 length:306 start_codon:yes stop_codon:yes gene_type:complete